MKLKITVHGVAYEVDVEVLDAEHDFLQTSPLMPAMPLASAAPMAAPAGALPVRPAPPGAAAMGAATGDVLSPIAGTVLEVKCKAGDTIKTGQELLVIEAMKMETAISSQRDGTIKRVAVAAGDAVRENELLVAFE